MNWQNIINHLKYIWIKLINESVRASIFTYIVFFDLCMSFIYILSYFLSINPFHKIVKNNNNYISYFTRTHSVHGIRQLLACTIKHRINTENSVFTIEPLYFLWAFGIYIILIISYTILKNYSYSKLLNLIGLQFLQGITVFLITIKASTGYLMWYHAFFTCLSLIALPFLVSLAFLAEFIYSVKSYHNWQHNYIHQNEMYIDLRNGQNHQYENQMYQQYEMYHNHQNEMNQLQSLLNHPKNTLPVSLFNIKALIRHLITHSNGFLWWLKHLVNKHMPKSQ